jgi:hypothetical protein
MGKETNGHDFADPRIGVEIIRPERTYLVPPYTDNRYAPLFPSITGKLQCKSMGIILNAARKKSSDSWNQRLKETL